MLLDDGNRIINPQVIFKFFSLMVHNLCSQFRSSKPLNRGKKQSLEIAVCYRKDNPVGPQFQSFPSEIFSLKCLVACQGGGSFKRAERSRGVPCRCPGGRFNGDPASLARDNIVVSVLRDFSSF